MYRLFVAILASVLVTGAASTLMAQEDEPGMRKGMHMIKKMDTDENGEISREEFVQAHEELFDSMDENGDGILDREELAAMMQKMRHHRRDNMEHHDKEDMDQQ